MIKHLLMLFLAGNFLFASTSSFLKELEEVLKEEVQSEEQRLSEFRKDVSSQEAKLASLKKNIEIQNAKNKTLKEQNVKNQKSLEEKEEELATLLGGLFSVLQSAKQVALTVSKGLESSYTQIQFPKNKDYFRSIANLKTIKMEDMQKFWLAISEEIIQSGSISSFDAQVINQNGKQSIQKVVRVGQFSAFSNGEFLKLSKDMTSLVALTNQPNFLKAGEVKEFEGLSGDVKEVLVDVTRGSLLDMLESEPTLFDRVKQGGIVGYVIIFLGVIGLLYALGKMIMLFVVHGRIKKQLKDIKTPTKNPLGSIIEVFNKYHEKPMNEIEIKVGEEIISQTNKIQSGKEFIKLIATITPLLGLLGTVTGMITTFQVITMFGTGDPKLMAGGISSALVTTVLGLIAAIPLLFAYSYVSSKVSMILSILEEQSMGLLAKNYHA